MLDFIPAVTRKKLYNWLVAINLTVGPLLGVLVMSGVIQDSLAQDILTIAAQVMSAAGFMLASKNVTLPSHNGGTIEEETSGLN